MKRLRQSAVVLVSLLFLSACGGGGSGGSGGSDDLLTGHFKDVRGAAYRTDSGESGITDETGKFEYRSGEKVTFFASDVKLGTVEGSDEISVFSFSYPDKVAQTLHALDTDANPANGITIPAPLQTNALEATALSKSRNVKIDLDSDVSEYNSDYIKLLKRQGILVENSKKALLREIALHLSYPSVSEPNFISQIMSGAYKIPLSRFSNENDISQLIAKKEEYQYKINLVTLHQMLLEILKTQQNDSSKMLVNADTYAKEIDSRKREIMYGVDTAINSANAIASEPDSMTKAMLTYLKAESKTSADYLAESELPEDLQTDTKLATTLVYDCAIEENPQECVINVMDNRMDKLIQTKLSERYPYAAIWAKGIKDILKDDYAIWSSCKKAAKGSKEMTDCVGKVTKTLLNNVYSLVGESMKIYHLSNDTTKFNSQAVAYDIFFLSKYLDTKSFTVKSDSYCGVVSSYGGDYETCKNHEHYIDDLKYVVEKAIDSGEISELISGIFNTTAGYDIDVVEETLLNLEKRYNELFKSFSQSLKRYRSATGIDDKRVDQWIYTQVHIDSPSVELLSEENGDVDLKACFEVHTDKAIEDVVASITITSEGGFNTIFPEYEFTQHAAFKGNRKFCGTLRGYRPATSAGEKIPAVITSRLSFRFSNTSSKTFDIHNFRFYNWNYTEEEPVGKSIDFTHPYDDKEQKYLLQAKVTGAEANRLSYHWRVESALPDCIAESDQNSLFIYPLKEICKSQSLVAHLAVYDADGHLIGTKSHSLDPILTIEDTPLSFGANPSLIELHTGESRHIELSPKGGYPPYHIKPSSDNDFFSYRLNGTSELIVSSERVAKQKEHATLTLTLTDAKGKQSTASVELSQTPPPPQSPLTIASSFKNKSPYSRVWNEWATKAPGSTFTQQWWLQNSSDRTLYQVILKPSRYCDSTLEHSRSEIVVGDLAPGEIANPKPSLFISGGGEEGKFNYCQWDLFAKDEAGKLTRLQWNLSKRPASLNYYILSKTPKDTRPPILKGFSSYYKEGKVYGSFTISHPTGQVKHLRLSYSPYRVFINGHIKTIDIGTDYESLQNTGTKSFEFEIGSWPTQSLFIKLEATNKDGTPLAEETTKGLRLVGYKVPEVLSLTPTKATLNTPTLFTISGINLPETLAMSLEGAECSGLNRLSKTRATVTCTPQSEGQKRFYVAYRPHGEKIKGQNRLYVNIQKAPEPTLTDILPGKTLYQYCSDARSYRYRFNTDGTLQVSDGSAEKDFAYRIIGNRLYVTRSGTEASMKLNDHTESYLKFGTQPKDIYYFTQSAARTHPRTDCQRPDDGDTEGGGPTTTPQSLPKVRIHMLPAKAATDTLTISWERVLSPSDDRAQYEISVADNLSFTGARTYSAGKNLTYQVTDLYDNTRYYFRVRAKNSQSTGPWSDTTSILIDLQNTPQFNTAFQKPADHAVNADKDPKFEWGATDSDGDDLEYYLEAGPSPDHLVYNSGWITKNHIYWHEISNDTLAPNTTYYWHVMVRESGRDKNYYGGAYPVSPLWSFTTVAKGPDLQISQVTLLDPIKPNREARLEVVIKNRGTEKIDNFYIRLRYKKNGQINDFATKPMQLVDTTLAPAEETRIILTADFRDELLQRNGKTYDNILAEGESYLIIDLPYSDDDINPADNRLEYKITYTDQGKPQFDFLYVGHQSLYAENKVHGTLGSILGGDSNGIEFSVRDDMKVTEAKVYYRLSSSDSWHLIRSFTSDKDHISELVKWTIPENQGYLTDTLQIRVTATDNSGNLSEIVSHSISVYDNHLAISIPTLSSHKVGERFTLPLQIDHVYDIDLIEVKLIANGHSTTLYSNIDTSGFTPPASVILTLPSENRYADAQAKLEIRVSDIHGNDIKKAFAFDLKPNLDTGDIFGKMITIYNEAYPDYPADSHNQSTDNSIQKVILDENNIAHMIVESTGWWWKNGENQMSRHVRNFYITYNYATKQLSTPQMLFDIRQLNNGNFPDESYKDFILTPDGKPLMVTWNSRTHTLRSHTPSGHTTLLSAEADEYIDEIKLFNHHGKIFLTYRSITSNDAVKRPKAMEIYPVPGTPHLIADGYYGREIRLHNDILYFPYTGKAFNVDANLVSTGQRFDDGTQNVTVYGDVVSYNNSYLDLQFDASHHIRLLRPNGETLPLVQVEDDDVLTMYKDRIKIDATILDNTLLYTYTYRPDPQNGSRIFKILKIGFDGSVQRSVNVGKMMDTAMIKNLVSINKNGLVAVADPDRGAAYLVIGDFSK